MRLQIEARISEKTTKTFTLRRGAMPLSKLNSLAKKGFPGIPQSRIKVLGGAPFLLGEAMALASGKL